MIEFKVPCRGPIKLGHTGENEAVRVAFSLLPFKEAFPDGAPALLVRRKGDAEAYPVTLTVEGDTAYWTVTSADTEKAGFGQCELQWYLGDMLAKSDKFDFLVAQALEAGAEPPDEPSKRWFEALEEKIGDLSKLTTKAKENLVAAINEAAKTGSGGAGGIEMQVSGGYIQYSTDGGETWENLIAVEDLKGGKGEKGDTGATPDIQIGTVTTLDAGADATASMGGTAESPLLNLGIPKGAKGDKGDKGDTGATGPQGAQGPAGDDYVLTDADKSEIAAEIIAGGVEAELGDEPLPAPASASVGQIVKVKAVDANGKVTQVEAVDMPGGSDASLGMTSAAVGQIAKITAVDADGKPTAWSPVDMPSGGGGVWTLVHEQTLTEAAESYTYALNNVRAAALVLIPNAAVDSGWKRVKINNLDVPLTNVKVDAQNGIAFSVDLDAPFKIFGTPQATGKVLGTYGVAGNVITSLTAGDITEINSIGVATSTLLIAGAKISIYVRE